MVLFFCFFFFWGVGGIFVTSLNPSSIWLSADYLLKSLKNYWTFSPKINGWAYTRSPPLWSLYIPIMIRKFNLYTILIITSIFYKVGDLLKIEEEQKIEIKELKTKIKELKKEIKEVEAKNEVLMNRNEVLRNRNEVLEKKVWVCLTFLLDFILPQYLVI